MVLHSNLTGSGNVSAASAGNHDSVSGGIMPKTSDRRQSMKVTNHIKRPMNAYMLWNKMHRKNFHEQWPNMVNTQISKLLSCAWKLLSKGKRQPFIEEAKRLHILHMLQYPDYKYRPKRKAKQLSKPEQSTSKHSLGNHKSSSGGNCGSSKPKHQRTSATTVSHTVYQNRLKLKLTIDKEFRDSIRQSKHMPLSVSQLNLPAKVPCSPSTDEPASPESANISLYDDPFNKSRNGASACIPQVSCLAEGPANSNLVDLDALVDMIQFPSDWAQELSSLTNLTELDTVEF